MALAEADRISAARRGDVAAFNQLVVAYQELAFNVARRLVGDDDTAADVTQDAFFSAFRHLHQFKGGSFRSWLLRIVTNGSYDALRARRRHGEESLDDLMEESAFDAPDPGDLPETVALRREQIAGLEAALQTLPLDQRSVLVLFDVHGLPYDEIATVLATNLGTVKSRLNRARRRLRDHMLRHPELWRP
jgi:RNA polymerase sigma-70 factor (ECF subfamily)